ncbi:MAG TPA: hypothetical protein VIY51_18220 [Xanthobacteraceae bacterium]
MRVVLAVAGIAIRGQRNLGDIPGDVAGLAIKTAVRPGQRVARLGIVIEAPPRPAIRVVAERTVRPQATFMMLIAVAGDARERRVLKQQRAMAFLARHDGMAPDQGKSRDVVIEGSCSAPAGLAVTLVASAAEPALVPVILSVTGHAGRCQLVAIEIARVAAVAPDFRVRGPQWKLCRFVVIKVKRRPLVLVVTAFALCAVPSGVDILDPVAIHTCDADVLVAFAGMAHGTGHATMRTLKRELRAVVVERLYATPCRLGMTTVACFSETPLMRIVRLVTVEAAPGRVAEFYRLRMTVAARHGRVCVPEREIRNRVIESLAVQLDDVGVSPLVIRMTMNAFLLRRIRITSVQPPAHLTVGGNFLVARETEPRLRTLRKRLVTVPALLLELGMPGHQRPGHDKPLE